MSPRTRWLILAFALAGLALAAGSSWVHYRLLTDPGYSSPCDINAKFNCSQVYLSRFGSVKGVPVALGGLIWFGLVTLITAFARPNDRESPAVNYLFLLGAVGLTVILYLGYVSFFVLHTGCVLCMGTYVCVLGIFLLASSIKGASLGRLPAQLSGDIRGVFSRPLTLLVAILYLAGAAAVVAFFPREGCLAAQAANAPAPSADLQQQFAEAWAKQPRVDLGIPADGARVVIVKFNDYECPTCSQAEQFYQPVIAKIQASNPGAIKYVLKDWPWNRECNFNTTGTIPGHEAACAAAAAARMARDKGKYDEMAAWLYSHQGVRPDDVKQAARQILGITNFDQEYALKLPDIRRDIADGGVLGINGTPTYFINGVRLANLIAPQFLELAISLELKKQS
jgi:uncharacterized membrane protein/protein-disulfide isomerase